MSEDNSVQIAVLRSRKGSYERQKLNKQATYNSNKLKIQRLYVVKSVLSTQKSNAKTRKSGLSNYVSSSDFSSGWSGARLNETQAYVGDTIVNAYQRYVDDIDYHLDALCDEITRLENENLALSGDILHLAGLINSLINQIAKLFN